MKWLFFTFSLFLNYIISTNGQQDQASFYGSSYISVPLQEAYANNDIEFSFRTWLPDALFLLVAGKIDFLKIQLESGLVKVRIDLGAGDVEISSPEGHRFDDGEWHKVDIIRREANLTLAVDNVHVIKKRLPGQFFELNIQFGVFIGGDGHFKEQFLGHMVGLRGCISGLRYAGKNLLYQAKRRQENSKVIGVTWNCAAEFDSNVATELSYVEDNAYMVLVHSIGRSGARWQFEMKTSITESIILYNIGASSNSHLIVVELIDGKLHLLLNNPKSTKVVNSVDVSDNKWHKVVIQFSPTMIELTVDTTMETTKISSRFLELTETYFIGGLELNMRTRALVKGVKTADMSYKGCLRGLAINGEPIGLPNARSTYGIISGTCVNEMQNKTAVALNILSVHPIQIREGGSLNVTQQHIHMVIDYQRYGLRDTSVIFTVLKQSHGRLVTSNNIKVAKFSLVDLYQEKITYNHDGSEDNHDSILIEVMLGDHHIATVPEYLQGSHIFTLPIEVSPVNDPPAVTSSLLRVAKGTKKTLSTENLNAVDPDNKPSEIVYITTEHDMATTFDRIGQFEFTDQPLKPIYKFSQSEIDSGMVTFSHFGSDINGVTYNNQSFINITLQITDGSTHNQTVVLAINVYDLELKLKNNKGLTMVHNSSALIQPRELSFVTNAADESVVNNIRFDVVEQPHYGQLQCEKERRYWDVCDWFLSGEIAQKKIRYRHVHGTPTIDEFRFRASINKIHTSIVYNFTITFVKLQLRKLHLRNLLLNGTSENTILFENIHYQTQPITSSNKNIRFIITDMPRYGYLFLSNTEKHLRNGDFFTQSDIEKFNLKYILRRRSFSNINDSFAFIINAKNCVNVTEMFHINYFPSQELYSKVQTTLKRLQVIEGEKANIGLSHLNIKIDFISELVYNMTQPPKHGVVQRCEEKNCSNPHNCADESYICANVTFFTSNNIRKGYIFYIHDDSESRYDFFHFTAFSAENDFQYVGVFYIDVILKNDKSPKREIDKVFQVVLNGAKVITGNDLKYVDEDINTRASDIVYTCQHFGNGAIYNTSRPMEKLTTFTQEDLNNNWILFRHHGDEYGKINLWVTDGQFSVNGDLEVHASLPFVKILHDEIVVQEKGQVVLDSKIINIDTNLYLKEHNIFYKVLKSPKSGYLRNVNRKEIAVFFTQYDISSGHVMYVHTNSSSNADSFVLRVACQNTSAEAKISLKVLPSFYWEPLEVASTNEDLFVEESTSIIITRKYLEVAHSGIPSDQIKYILTTKPKHGYLRISSIGPSDPIDTFDQSLVNDGRLHYIQNVANKTYDKMVFNVTNSIVWLQNLVLNVQIIPEHFYIKTTTLNITEGESIVIKKSYLKIITDYYKEKIIEYTVIRDPKHGYLQIGNSKGEVVRRFTERELQKEFVKYVHDSSENFEDNFDLVGHTDSKESAPTTVHVIINPINDQPPMLVNNTGLQMWEGGFALLSNSYLGATDADIPSDLITFNITASWWGNCNILLQLNATPVTSFTQEQLEKRLIYFSHTNGSMAKFTFRITDGVHTSRDHTFIIETKPVQLSLRQNLGLHVFPLNRQQITERELRTETSDPDRKITYIITKAPSLGRIVIEADNGNFYTVDKFTQHEVTLGRIYYEHTHPFDSLYSNDSFIFDIEAKLAPPLLSQVFNIDISVSSGGLNSYVTIIPIMVDEGGSTTVHLNMSRVVSFLETHANIPAPIIFATVWPSSHGTVYATNSENTNITTFTQSQFDSGFVKYQHDHSDTLNDTLFFTLYLLPNYIMLCNVTIPVNIIPINDQPFKLITQAPSMSVVYGENATITKDLLLTEDSDTPAEELEYDVITAPSEGKLLLLPEGRVANKFSQRDINDGRVVYTHSGSNSTVTFYFRVGDGKFKPVYTIFNIRITPIEIHLTNGVPLYIQQGSNVATLTKQHADVKTNVDLNRVKYNVTRLPVHGTIYVHDAPRITFTHSDLSDGRVMYMQTDMTTANDTFRMLAHVDKIAVSETVTIFMLVQPLMQRGNFTVMVGLPNKITLNALDATPLANLTSSNPKYSIVRKPNFGTINKIIRSTGDRRLVYDYEVDRFTHEEIRSGLIYYVAGGDESLIGLEDLFEFVLSGSIFQPAASELRFRILSDKIEPELKRHRGGMHIASPNMSTDYLPIIVMAISVIILGICVIIVIKCRTIGPIKEELNSTDPQQPIPLPRPPDHLMASTPHLKRYISEELTLPTPISVPHCKVTPLGPVESLASSEMDVQSRYPYGSAEDATEDWVSHDASDSTNQQPVRNAANPLLRRNQYWV